MIVVAGPPGSGKTSGLPATSFGVDSFNADDRAAQLNQGSYHKISRNIRAKANLEFEQWIRQHIDKKKSFALETTLRSQITFEQSHWAHSEGFWTSMHFINAGSVEQCVQRVMYRSYRGGHSASEKLVADIYHRSTSNLLFALDFENSKFETVRIYDNSSSDLPVRELMNVHHGRVLRLSTDIPDWLYELVRGTEFDIERVRKALSQKT